MKKIMYSVIASILLLGTLTAVASAATNSLIGKKVQSVVSFVVDGKSVKDAIIIDGTTYVPARSFSEAAGYSIAIEGGTVKMTATQEEEAIVKEIQATSRIGTLQYNILVWTTQLSGEKEAAELARKSIEKIDALNANSSAEAPKVDDTIVKEKLANAEAAIAELEAKITAAEAEIAELQAKIDANK